MANRINSTQEVIYELTKEDMEDIIIAAVEAKAGEVLSFTPNKMSVDFSDPENGIYQVRFNFDESLPQVMPLREVGPGQP
jgi:hypothetical protein